MAEASGFGIVAHRPDYGGQWDGQFEIDGVTVINKIAPISLVNLSTNPIGNALLAVQCPDISISNIEYQQVRTGDDNLLLLGVDLAVTADALGVVAPALIDVKGLKGRRTRIGNKIALGDMQSNAGTGGVQINLHDIKPQLSPNADAPEHSTLYVPPKTNANATQFAVDVSIFDVEQCALHLSETQFASRIRVGFSHVVRALLHSSYSITYTGCEFSTPVLFTGESAAPLAPAAASNRYGSICGGRLAGAFDLGAVRCCAGLASIDAEITGTVWPAGQSALTALTGWRV